MSLKGQPNPAEVRTVATQGDNAALARRWFDEVWGQRRTATVREMVLPDSVCHSEHGEMVGPDPFLDFHARMLRALPDLRVEVEAVVAEGDSAVVRWRMEGTHTGDFDGEAPTGQAFRRRGVTWIRYRDGKMAEGWECWDAGGLVRQFGGGPG
jgi:steroid delta-isomerase-like uncharacterized protein